MCSFACAHFLLLIQNGQKQTDPGSLEDLSRDETDRAVPLSEPITIQRRSPLIRNHKTGSMEVRCLFIVITLVSSGICWKTHFFTGFGFLILEVEGLTKSLVQFCAHGFRFGVCWLLEKSIVLYMATVNTEPHFQTWINMLKRKDTKHPSEMTNGHEN